MLEIDEPGKRLNLWVRRKRANKLLVCFGCSRPTGEMIARYERKVRDLPCFEYMTTVVIELHRVRCPDYGIKAEKVPLLPGKALFSNRFEDAVGRACES
jgi:transposase